MSSLKNLISQSFPPKPTFTDKDIPDLSGKVCIVTGANTGVGKEIAQMLYAHNAKVYMAARSETKTRKAIESIIAAVPKSSGQLCVLSLDLADLNLVKEAAEAFKKQEHQLHLLFNNAGVGYPDPGSKTAQGYELQLGVNCVGPFLFTKLLAPTLIYTAKNSPSNSVRVIWTSSSATEGISANGFMDNLDYHIEKSGFHKYCMSKIGNYLHSTEFAARYKQHGIISVSLNPGHLDSDFWRTQSPLVLWLLRRTVLYPTVFGAYTSVFAAFSPKISLENSGTFIAPWGRLWQMTADKSRAAKSKAEGGSGAAEDFWKWSEAQVSSYAS